MIQFVYDCLYIVPLALTAMYYYCGLLGVEKPLPMYISMLVLVIILTLFPELGTRGRILLAGIVAAGTAGYFFVLRDYAEDYLFTETGLVPILAVSAGAFLTGMLTARSRIFRNIVAISLAVFLGLSLEFLRLPAGSGKAVFAAFFLLMEAVVNEIHLSWKRSGDTDEKKHMVFTAPFVLAAVLFASLFKYPEHPYDWNLFVNIWNRVTVAFEKVRFELEGVGDAVMGFSDDGELLHSVGKGSDEILLEVEAPADVYAPVNLTGAVYDTFDGHRWSKAPHGLADMRKFDVYESLTGARTGTGDHRDILRSVNIRVLYKKAKSGYLFAPSKTETLTAVSKKGDYRESDGMITFEGYNPFRFEVSEVYYKLNTDNPVFYEYMAGEWEFTEEDWNRLVNTEKGRYSYDNYLGYRDAVESIYGGKTEVSKELRDILDTVYEGARSDYDKMKRLEKVLNGMAYTTDTGPIPEDVKDPGGFLDHFLLEAKEGFCTHFATAFVLLARAEGLPARYVQGYRLGIDRAGTYGITGGNAHAWPEVYFRGKGWVAFEPTPGFNQEVAWQTVAAKNEEFRAMTAPGNVFEKSEEPVLPEKEKRRIDPRLILMPAGGILLFLILFTILVRLISGYRFRKLSGTEKLLWLSKDILACLSLMGDRKKENETLGEFTERVREDMGETAFSFAAVYERLIYSRFKEEPDDLETITACHRDVLLCLKKHNRFKYAVRMLLSQY